MMRVLVVGTGSIGQRHVRCYLSTGRAVVGICEPGDALRERVASEYALAGAYASLDLALAHPWDAAVVATPASTHIAIAQALAEKKIHLLIEKPLATTPEGINRLMQTVAANELTAGVAYVYRAHPVLADLHEALRAGRFGAPLQLVLNTGQCFPHFRPEYRQTYYADRARGGGAVQDALTHFINLGEWLIGPVTRLAADADRLKIEGVDVEDTVHVIARHGQAMASYSLNQHQAPNETTITLVCERGTIVFEMHEHRWRWMNEPGTPWQEARFAPMERDTWFTRQCTAFLNAIEHRRPMLCSLPEGLQTLHASLAILASADAGGGMIAVDSVPVAAIDRA